MVGNNLVENISVFTHSSYSSSYQILHSIFYYSYWNNKTFLKNSKVNIIQDDAVLIFELTLWESQAFGPTARRSAPSSVCCLACFNLKPSRVGNHPFQIDGWSRVCPGALSTAGGQSWGRKVRATVYVFVSNLFIQPIPWNGYRIARVQQRVERKLNGTETPDENEKIPEYHI